MCETKATNWYDVKLYQEVSEDFLKEHTKFIVDTYGGILDWNKNERREEILDIGCGEGSTTVQILSEFVSRNTKNYNILGTDMLKPMINFAQEKFLNVPRIQFKQINVLDEKPWISYKDTFDKVFSFLCLMLVPNPKIWIRNIYNVLKPNGQIFFMLVITNPMVKYHLYLCKQEKWGKYQKNNKLYSEFLLNENPAKWITQHLKEGGFKNVMCHEVIYDSCLKNKQNAYRFTKAFTMLYETIPEEFQEEYLNDLCEGIEEECLKNEEYSKFLYLVILGRK